MIDTSDRDDWRTVMLAQYNSFTAIAGLKVASLAIFATLLKTPVPNLIKIVFTLSAVALFIEIPLILWLINEERKVAFNDGDMRWFKTNEKHIRKFLIGTVVFGWIMILILLVLSVWR